MLVVVLVVRIVGAGFREDRICVTERRKLAR
jgi:hypothetical protein